MKKSLKMIAVALVLVVCTYMVSLASDKKQLSNDILRLHVVGASNSLEDQEMKLQVRDAVLAAVQDVTAGVTDKQGMDQCLRENLQNLEDAANNALRELGSSHQATVTLGQEEFPLREYDTFTLPAGVYDSLRVTIGEGQGRNWWCVVFPSLCIPAATEKTKDVAVGAGFSDSLTGAITGDERYEVRFFLLDVWGRLEKFFHKG